MMYWLYVKHHWKPSEFAKMGHGEQIVVRGFFLKEMNELKEQERMWQQ